MSWRRHPKANRQRQGEDRLEGFILIINYHDFSSVFLRMFYAPNSVPDADLTRSSDSVTILPLPCFVKLMQALKTMALSMTMTSWSAIAGGGIEPTSERYAQP